MVTKSDTKLRILAVNKLLHEYPNGLSIKEILDKLHNIYNISADRKSIYDNLNTITYFCNLQITKEHKYKIENML
jgi:hypothetical protein